MKETTTGRFQCRILSHTRHPTIVGFGNITFVMFIHYGVPEGVSLACDAVGPAAVDDYAIVGGSLDPNVFDPSSYWNMLVLVDILNSKKVLALLQELEYIVHTKKN